MNILPKKSWHVRNKDNVERVRRDEENARKEEKEKERRAALAEQEARIALLRDRASEKKIEDDKAYHKSLMVVKKPQHLNLFADIADGASLQFGNNPEYEAEKKAEKEKQEEAIGVLTYLGQSATRGESERLWYVKSHKDRVDLDKASQSSRDNDRKNSMDPLTKMKKFLDAKKAHHGRKETHKKKEHGKCRHKNQSEKEKEKFSLKKLRMERLKREKEEHAREQQLLASLGGDKTIVTTQPAVDTEPYRYNSQYNPEFVRRPRNHRDRRFQPC